MGEIDLHMHTTASDGTDCPAEVIRRAAELGLRAAAVTDHDSVSGVEEARRTGRELGVEVIPGIEVSSDYKDNNIHILGYFMDIHSPALQPVLEWVKKERDERNRKMVAMLAADGFDISMEELERAYPDAVIGRPHVAEWLMKKGYISSVTEGFERYLEVGRPYFLPKRRVPIADAIRFIRRAGGLPVLAHPFQYRYSHGEVMELIETAAALGIGGIEAYYSLHTPEQQTELLSLAEKMGLPVSGGSDYHGSRKPHISIGRGTGALDIPYSVLENLKKAPRGEI